MRLSSATNRFVRARSSRVLTLAALVGVVGAIGTADVASASLPPGVNCAADGKIDGRGATFQTAAQQNVFAPGFRDDVCGAVGTAGVGDAGDTMVAYNYAAAVAANGTGSGAGRTGIACRSDDYAGTDTPYDKATLLNLNAAGFGSTTGFTCPGASFTPPFAPATSPFPDANDHPAKIMSFPVAGSSVTILANLPDSFCGGSGSAQHIAALNLTRQNVSDLFGGNILNWNDARLTANNPGLSACTGAVTRIVRLDSSGTTQITKNFLKNVDGARTTATCDATAGSQWSNLALNANNVNWPGAAPTAGCSTLVKPTANGNPGMLTTINATPGGVAYVDLADASLATTQNYSVSNVQNALNTSFEAPASETVPNCNIGVAASLPGSSAAQAVGLDTTNSWALDNNSGNHGDATNQGGGYPICGLTFDLVYTNTSGNLGGLQPIARMNNDQRRTLYSYESYILSSTAQERLSANYYSALPLIWISKLRAGFQANY